MTLADNPPEIDTLQALAKTADYFMKTKGIYGIRLFVRDGVELHREGNEVTWCSTLTEEALRFARRAVSSGNLVMRLMLEECTVVMQQEPGLLAIIVVETGHPITKSMRRMIRRQARHVEAPGPKEAPRATNQKNEGG